MVITSIREFNRAVPFTPYEIKTVSGDRYTVPHPDFISISPKGSFVVFIDAKELPHHLSYFLIERASLLDRNSRRKNGKRRPSVIPLPPIDWSHRAAVIAEDSSASHQIS